jgi:hypothetical protein
MKAILEFNLDDHEERMAHFRCIKSDDMAFFIFELINNTRHRVESICENSDINGIDAMFEIISEYLVTFNINIDELIE